jgi:ribosome biogenesis protein BMS1
MLLFNDVAYSSHCNTQAKKKEAHQKKKKGLSTERHNPRAFSVANIKRTQRNTQRNLDRAQQ